MIEPAHPQLSIARQCGLVGLPRSSWYYQPAPVDAATLCLLRLLDEQYTRTPFYGIRRMTAWLRTQGRVVNHKRVQRLLRRMGLTAIYPGPRTSVPHPDHRVYPYLLRGVPITRANQVWSTDITSIRLQNGRGRALDNILVERLWRTVKYEEVYVKEYASMGEAVVGLRAYFRFYNEERLHQALGYCPPAAVWQAA